MSASNLPPKITCPHCQGTMKSPSLPAGSAVTCPKCSKAFRLGDVAASPAAKAPPSPLSKAGPPAPKAGPTQPVARPPQPARTTVPATPPSPVARKAPPAPRPSAAPSDDGFVPLGDEPIAPAAAAASTQPAHRPPDPTPPPPKPPPKPAPPKEVAVICYLCGTRMYAPLEKIGKTVQCPDCHAVNEVKRKEVVKKAAGPTLEDAPDYAMSEPVTRPGYQPIIAARGDYAELAEFDPEQRPPGWTHPDARRGAAVAQSHKSSAASSSDDEEEGEEFTLAAPVDRIEIKPELPQLPPPDPEASLYDGKYDDNLLGGGVDRRQKDAWKKAPFLLKLVEFLFYMSTLPRLVFYSIGLAIVIAVGHTAYRLANDPSPAAQIMAIFTCMALSAMTGFWILSFSAVALAVVQDTANGMDEVASWPDWNFFDWIGSAFYFPIGAFASGSPGVAMALFLVAGGLPFAAAPLPVLLSLLVLFPMVMYSMLVEGSIMGLVSGQLVRSFHVASEGWLLFYMYSLVIGLLVAVFGALAEVDSVVVNIIAAAGLVPLALLYCRLLGRMMWYAAEKEAKAESQGV